MNKIKQFSVLALLPLLLSACSLFGRHDAVVACPDTGIVKEAARLPVFNDADTPQADMQPVAVDAAIMNFSGHCTEKKPGQVSMDLAVSFKGVDYRAASKSKPQDLPYFIAVLAPDQQILQREAFSTRLDFDKAVPPPAAADGKPAAPQAVSVEEHSIRLPLAEGENPADYKVVIGFALTPEQLNYDRKQK
jgi:hypothetical protein